MLWKNSRYLTVDENIVAIDPNSNELKTTLGIRSFKRRPPTDSFVYTTKDKDDLFMLANKYYKDARLWHIIADANSSISDPYDIPVGTNLFIPPLEVRRDL